MTAAQRGALLSQWVKPSGYNGGISRTGPRPGRLLSAARLGAIHRLNLYDGVVSCLRSASAGPKLGQGDFMRETQLEDVFGIRNRVNSLSYCDRGGLDARFTYLLGADRHIVVHGDSKQGKSWLREKAVRAEDTLLVQCRVDTEATEDIFVSALGQLGVFVESARTQKIGLTGSAEAHAGTQMSLPFFKGDAGVSGAGERSRTRGMQYEPIGQNVKDLFWVAEQIRNSKKRLVVGGAQAAGGCPSGDRTDHAATAVPAVAEG